jgi:uncharacterized SAM-binding protein YcdF (DUF218 family)
MSIETSLEVNLVLGGEGQDFSRSTKALQLYEIKGKPIFITGGVKGKDGLFESERSKEYLLEKGVAKKDIALENTSKDHIHGIYNFERYWINEHGLEKTTVNIITDDANIPRSAWLADILFRPYHIPKMVPTGKKASRLGNIIENTIFLALQQEFSYYDVRKQDSYRLERYLGEHYPFEHEPQLWPAYNLVCKLAKKR